MSEQICLGCDAKFKTRKRKEPKFTGWMCPDCERSDFEQYCRSVGAKQNSIGEWVMDFEELTQKTGDVE